MIVSQFGWFERLKFEHGTQGPLNSVYPYLLFDEIRCGELDTLIMIRHHQRSRGLEESHMTAPELNRAHEFAPKEFERRRRSATCLKHNINVSARQDQSQLNTSVSNRNAFG
jgi:hypothetical protein